MSTVVVGFDYSMTGPAMCITDGSQWFIAYATGKKKLVGSTFTKPNFRVKALPIPLFEKGNDAQRFHLLSDEFMRILAPLAGKIAMIGIEGYAFGAKGQVFNIGENTGVLKHKLWHVLGLRATELSPTEVKMFAIKGNAKKPEMEDAFAAMHGWRPSSEIGCNIGDSPAADVVDSYFVCELTRKRLAESFSALKT